MAAKMKDPRVPCPFCKSRLIGAGWGTEKIARGRDFCQIHCRKCGASGPRALNEDDAWAGWSACLGKGLPR